MARSNTLRIDDEAASAITSRSLVIAVQRIEEQLKRSWPNDILALDPAAQRQIQNDLAIRLRRAARTMQVAYLQVTFAVGHAGDVMAALDNGLMYNPANGMTVTDASGSVVAISYEMASQGDYIEQQQEQATETAADIIASDQGFKQLQRLAGMLAQAQASAMESMEAQTALTGLLRTIGATQQIVRVHRAKKQPELLAQQGKALMANLAKLQDNPQLSPSLRKEIKQTLQWLQKTLKPLEKKPGITAKIQAVKAAIPKALQRMAVKVLGKPNASKLNGKPVMLAFRQTARIIQFPRRNPMLMRLGIAASSKASARVIPLRQTQTTHHVAAARATFLAQLRQRTQSAITRVVSRVLPALSAIRTASTGFRLPMAAIRPQQIISGLRGFVQTNISPARIASQVSTMVGFGTRQAPIQSTRPKTVGETKTAIVKTPYNSTKVEPRTVPPRIATNPTSERNSRLPAQRTPEKQPPKNEKIVPISKAIPNIKVESAVEKPKAPEVPKNPIVSGNKPPPPIAPAPPPIDALPPAPPAPPVPPTPPTNSLPPAPPSPPAPPPAPEIIPINAGELPPQPSIPTNPQPDPVPERIPDPSVKGPDSPPTEFKAEGEPIIVNGEKLYTVSRTVWCPDCPPNGGPVVEVLTAQEQAAMKGNDGLSPEIIDFYRKMGIKDDWNKAKKICREGHEGCTDDHDTDKPKIEQKPRSKDRDEEFRSSKGQKPQPRKERRGRVPVPGGSEL